MDLNLNEYLSKRKKSITRNLSFSLAYFLYMLGWGFVNPIFSIKVNNITGSFFLSGIFFSLWGGIKMFLNIFAGLLSDRTNVKRIIQYSLLSYSTLVAFGYFFAESIPTLFIVRVIHIISGTFVWTGYWVYLRRKGKTSVEKISVPRTFIKAAKLVGPFIGGIIATYIYPELTFIMLSISTLISVLVVTFCLEDMPRKKEDHILENFRNKLKEISIKAKKMLLIGIALTVVTFTTRSFLQYFPLLMKQEGFSPGVIGTMFSINILPGLVTSIPIGALSDHITRKKPIFCGFILLSLGYFFFGVSSDLLVWAGSTFMIGIGTTLIFPVLNSLVSENGDDNEKGEVTGIGESFKDFGGFVGPLSFGLISTLQNLRLGFLMLMILSLIPVGLILIGKSGL